MRRFNHDFVSGELRFANPIQLLLLIDHILLLSRLLLMICRPGDLVIQKVVQVWDVQVPLPPVKRVPAVIQHALAQDYQQNNRQSIPLNPGSNHLSRSALAAFFVSLLLVGLPFHDLMPPFFLRKSFHLVHERLRLRQPI